MSRSLPSLSVNLIYLPQIKLIFQPSCTIDSTASKAMTWQSTRQSRSKHSPDHLFGVLASCPILISEWVRNYLFNQPHLQISLESVLKSLGLRHYFQFIQLSYSLDLEKPDPRVFHAAMAKAKESLGDTTLLASECLHVGDDYEKDVVGARTAGWNVLLVDRSGDHPNTDLTSLRPLSGLDK